MASQIVLKKWLIIIPILCIVVNSISSAFSHGLKKFMSSKKQNNVNTTNISPTFASTRRRQNSRASTHKISSSCICNNKAANKQQIKDRKIDYKSHDYDLEYRIIRSQPRWRTRSLFVRVLMLIEVLFIYYFCNCVRAFFLIRSTPEDILLDTQSLDHPHRNARVEVMELRSVLDMKKVLPNLFTCIWNPESFESEEAVLHKYSNSSKTSNTCFNRAFSHRYLSLKDEFGHFWLMSYDQKANLKGKSGISFKKAGHSIESVDKLATRAFSNFEKRYIKTDSEAVFGNASNTCALKGFGLARTLCMPTISNFYYFLTKLEEFNSNEELKQIANTYWNLKKTTDFYIAVLTFANTFQRECANDVIKYQTGIAPKSFESSGMREITAKVERGMQINRHDVDKMKKVILNSFALTDLLRDEKLWTQSFGGYWLFSTSNAVLLGKDFEFVEWRDHSSYVSDYVGSVFENTENKTIHTKNTPENSRLLTDVCKSFENQTGVLKQLVFCTSNKTFSAKMKSKTAITGESNNANITLRKINPNHGQQLNISRRGLTRILPSEAAKRRYARRETGDFVPDNVNKLVQSVILNFGVRCVKSFEDRELGIMVAEKVLDVRSRVAHYEELQEFARSRRLVASLFQDVRDKSFQRDPKLVRICELAFKGRCKVGECYCANPGVVGVTAGCYCLGDLQISF